MGVKTKVWTGSAWVQKPLKTWSGTAWVTKPVKYWTGSAWVGDSVAWTPANASTPAIFWVNETSIVQSGGVVSQWTDLGTGAHNMTPDPTSPAYVASAINGKPGVSFTGGGSLKAASAVYLNPPIMVVIVWKQSATAPNDYGTLFRGAADPAQPDCVTFFNRHVGYSNDYLTYTGVGSDVVDHGTVITPNSGPYHSRVLSDGAFSSSVLNTSVLTGVTFGTYGLYGGIRLGGVTASATASNAIVSELFVIPYANHTAAAANAPTDATNAAAYTLAKWGV